MAFKFEKNDEIKITLLLLRIVLSDFRFWKQKQIGTINTVD